MNHLDKGSVKRYLDKFDRAFQRDKVTYPKTFFNDSYEVYQADWTPALLEEFARRRGYKLENYFPEFLDEKRPEITTRIITDYRETISDLLIENFTRQWTAWAHKHGSITRNQGHGSPANLIDVYASVDIPECEGFGLSQFHIKGLRQDSLTRKNDSDISMLKYASSAAHITGKPYTSSETFTWLTEHFRTSLSQCKPEYGSDVCLRSEPYVFSRHPLFSQRGGMAGLVILLPLSICRRPIASGVTPRLFSNTSPVARVSCKWVSLIMTSLFIFRYMICGKNNRDGFSYSTSTKWPSVLRSL